MATVGETAARREAELRERAAQGEKSREPVAPPVGDVIADSVVAAFRRAGARWRQLSTGLWWERVIAASVAILAITAVCAIGVGLVFGLIHEPALILAGVGLLLFGAVFLRYMWWGIRR